LKKTGLVQLNIYNLNGQLVKTLVNQQMAPGSYKATFDGANLSSGIYYYKLTVDGRVFTKKMMLVK
jgi:flagellar hook assembly protein FlgD